MVSEFVGCALPDGSIRSGKDKLTYRLFVGGLFNGNVNLERIKEPGRGDLAPGLNNYGRELEKEYAKDLFEAEEEIKETD